MWSGIVRSEEAADCQYGTFSARLRHTIMDEAVSPNGRVAP